MGKPARLARSRAACAECHKAKQCVLFRLLSRLPRSGVVAGGATTTVKSERRLTTPAVSTDAATAHPDPVIAARRALNRLYLLVSLG